MTAEDTTAVARLLLHLGDGHPPRSLSRALRSCSGRRRIGGTFEARTLARALVNAVPSARLPGLGRVAPSAASTRSIDTVGVDTGSVDTGSLDTGSTGARSVGTGSIGARAVGSRHRRRDRAIVRGGTGIAVALAVGVSFIGARSALTRDGRSQPAVACPPADEGCVARRLVSGSVLRSPAGRFALVGPAGIEVNGRWGCGPTALPAFLDVARGNVWVFDRWPSDPSGVPGRLLETVPGAAGLHVLPGSGPASSCDKLLVERRRGPVIVIDPSGARGAGSEEPAGSETPAGSQEPAGSETPAGSQEVGRVGRVGGQ